MMLLLLLRAKVFSDHKLVLSPMILLPGSRPSTISNWSSPYPLCVAGPTGAVGMMGIACSLSGPVGSLLKPNISLFFNLFDDAVALLLGFGTSGGLTAFSAIVSSRVGPINAMIWPTFTL
jgi:hypothetical protein